MLAVVFPGQGSQYVGMGRALYEVSDRARQIFEQAEAVCGQPIKKLCFEGPVEELTRTENLQPALTAVNLAVWEVLRERGLRPDFLAGHSLGEYAALAAAEVISTEDAFKLVKARGEVMARAGEVAPGSMYAVIGLSREKLEPLLQEAPGRVYLANHNSPEQIVISGEAEAAEIVARRAREAGARVVKLKVSGAFHSPLMAPAAEEFQKYLSRTEFQPPKIPVVLNVTAAPEKDPEKIRTHMIQQMLSPVRWVESIHYMFQAGVRIFLEAGPKQVLSGLIRKTLKNADIRILQVEDPDTLEEALKILASEEG